MGTHAHGIIRLIILIKHKRKIHGYISLDMRAITSALNYRSYF